MVPGGKLNALTHLVGAGLSLGGAIVLVAAAVALGDPWKVVSVTIYGVTLFWGSSGGAPCSPEASRITS
jgi:hemolysin III